MVIMISPLFFLVLLPPFQVPPLLPFSPSPLPFRCLDLVLIIILFIGETEEVYISSWSSRYDEPKTYLANERVFCHWMKKVIIGMSYNNNNNNNLIKIKIIIFVNNDLIFFFSGWICHLSLQKGPSQRREVIFPLLSFFSFSFFFFSLFPFFFISSSLFLTFFF